MKNQLAALNQPVHNLSFSTTENPNSCFADFQGKVLVLYFYPKDNTPGCTMEAKDFRDMHSQFMAANAYIIGVSRDTLASHHDFKEQCELLFPLASDENQTLCQYFDVIKEKNMYGKKSLGIERSTFLIDRAGVLRQEWRNVKVPGHVASVLNAARACK